MKDKPIHHSKFSTHNSLIPELRFPEFLEDGEWEEKTLIEVASIKRGAASIHLTYIEKDTPSSIRLLRINDFLNNQAVYVKDTEDMKRFRVKTDDILIAGTGATAGITFIVPSEFNNLAFSYNAPRIRVNISDKYFVYHYLNSDSILEQQKRMFVGNAQPFLDTKAIGNLKIFIPKHKEQQKIASCLSSLDDVIAAHSQKLEALKGHKKGLMQNLFPITNDELRITRVPEWRFPEFLEDGEWEVKKLENYIDLFSGIALKSEEISDDESGIPILRGINITEGYIRHSIEIDKYFVGDIENLNKYLIKENDIVIGMDGSKVGKNVALIKKEDENSILIQRVARIRTNEKSDIKYVYHQFLSNKFRGYVDTVNTSSGIPHISAQQIKDFKIGFPPKLKEQQKIAECLSSLDELITAQAEKIEQLKRHKRGLMQGLFPSIKN